MEIESTEQLKGYQQWATFTISPKILGVTIKNISLKEGKLWDGADKDHELSIAAAQGVLIQPGTSFKFGGCGREYSAFGTEGSFELWAKNHYRIGTYSWQCAWDKKSNSSLWTPGVAAEMSWRHLTQVTGANYEGPLGHITLLTAAF